MITLWKTKKYNFLAATKPNALLAKFLSNYDTDTDCLSYVSNLQTDKIFKELEGASKYHDHCDILLPEKLSAVNSPGKEVTGNTLKQQTGNKS